jgi:class 3 adenylate cyclase/CheY-like chemotaxis protein
MNNTKLEMFCVFYVDMESSTYNTARLRPEDYSMYYAAFYDTLSDIARKYGGRVIKHVGDALIIYFPATSDPSDRLAFRSTLDSGIAMLEAQNSISIAFEQENLPPLSYRISGDYGRMEPIETLTSPSIDWIGPSMNMVAKMNKLARSNTMVVGGDLHQICSKFSFPDYIFDFAGELNIGIKQKYPVYSVVRKKCNNMSISASGVAESVVAEPIFRLGRHNLGAVETSAGSNLLNVVIIDDEQDILHVYKQYLAGHPINVEVFVDPIQLLGRLAQVGPSYYDLAIIDVKMPKISGFQLYQILTALKPNIKTLFVSALDYAGDVLAGLRGIDKEEDFIKKPVSRETFLCAVNRKIRLYA